MTTKNLALNRLIYGMTNTIVISEPTYKEAIIQIEQIKSSMEIEGFIFRPNFATSTNLTAYTNEDWKAMYAQYSLTYGWSMYAEKIFNEEPKSILEKYFACQNNDNITEPTAITPVDKKYNVEDTSFYTKVITDIVTSKIVLRNHQIQILNLMPIEYIIAAYKNNKITIKETEILLIKRLVEAHSNSFHFREPDQIVRFVVSAYRSNGEYITGQLSNTILKNVTIKLKTSVRKKILNDLNKINNPSFNKYNQFWKRLLKQLAWTSEAKLSTRYPNYQKIKNEIYNPQIQTINSQIQDFRREGNLQSAFLMEMKNPGQMIRNLFSYLRYPVGSQYASKTKTKEIFSVSEFFTVRLKPNNLMVVTNDISKILKSNLFTNMLEKVNAKLLWQVLIMLDDEKWYESMSSRVTNDTRIAYTTDLPALDKQMSKDAKKAIKKAIKTIKKEENKSLGKVYIDDTVENHMIQFSGRKDTSISLSGKYLTPGSKININDIIVNKKDPLIRFGLAWRSKKDTNNSCDIDLSLNIKNYHSVNYGSPTLTSPVTGNVIISSSGDITSCSDSIFSTELVDVDINECKIMDIEYMYSSAIMYSGQTFDNYECFWFINVIDKSERINPGRQIQIKLDEMQYALQIQEKSRGILGLKIDIKENIIEILNLPVQLEQHSNASVSEEKFNELIKNKPKLISIKKALTSVIKKSQLTDYPTKADLIISENTYAPTEPNAITLHPGRDQNKIQEIIY